LQPDVAAPLVIFFRQQALPIWLAWFDIGFDVVIADGGMELPVLWGCAQGAFRLPLPGWLQLPPVFGTRSDGGADQHKSRGSQHNPADQVGRRRIYPDKSDLVMPQMVQPAAGRGRALP
jgi:hypothetical protein